ncbi:serine hydrolase domain-containing protein [Streptodolium elevatio]
MPLPSSEQADAVAKFLGENWPEGAGGSVVTARNGELVSCQGLGRSDEAAGRAAGCDTVYDIGSITKSFTAAAVLKLEMNGALRVTDSIGVHLGAVPADKRAITIHQLLTHTSGLPEGIGEDYEPLSRDAMLGRALATPLEAAPGEEFAYSNTGYSVLAAVVEKVSGMSYGDFLARNLFGPAGMTRTGYVLPDPGRGDVAVEYDEQGASQGRPFEHPWAPDGPYWNLRGNGGLLSTASDMFRWYRALEGDTILNGAAKAKMFTPHVPEGDGLPSSYGYGLTVFPTDKGPLITHDGGNDWSFARFAIRPSDHTMVFWATNTAIREGKWDLEDQDADLTQDLIALAAAKP